MNRLSDVQRQLELLEEVNQTLSRRNDAKAKKIRKNIDTIRTTIQTSLSALETVIAPQIRELQQRVGLAVCKQETVSPSSIVVKQEESMDNEQNRLLQLLPACFETAKRKSLQELAVMLNTSVRAASAALKVFDSHCRSQTGSGMTAVVVDNNNSFRLVSGIEASSVPKFVDPYELDSSAVSGLVGRASHALRDMLRTGRETSEADWSKRELLLGYLLAHAGTYIALQDMIDIVQLKKTQITSFLKRVPYLNECRDFPFSFHILTQPRAHTMYAFLRKSASSGE